MNIKKNLVSKFLISFVIYSIIGIFFFTITEGKIFENLFNSGLEAFLKLIFIGNEVGLLSHIKLADQSFFFIFYGIYFCFLGVYLVLNQKKIIFSNNYILSSNEKVFNNLKKNEIYLYIILAAGLSLFIELSIIRIHSSYIHFFSFLNLTILIFKFNVFKINIELFKKFLDPKIILIISLACKDPTTHAAVPRTPS